MVRIRGEERKARRKETSGFTATGLNAQMMPFQEPLIFYAVERGQVKGFVPLLILAASQGFREP